MAGIYLRLASAAATAGIEHTEAGWLLSILQMVAIMRFAEGRIAWLVTVPVIVKLPAMLALESPLKSEGEYEGPETMYLLAKSIKGIPVAVAA